MTDEEIRAAASALINTDADPTVTMALPDQVATWTCAVRMDDHLNLIEDQRFLDYATRARSWFNASNKEQAHSALDRGRTIAAQCLEA